MPPEHVDAIANLSNSRGASACVYGTAFLAILLIGDQNLADNFKISAEYANALLVAARFLPEFLSPLSTRLRKHLFWSLSIFLLLIAMAVCLPARLTVSNSLLFWFFFHCLFRTYPWLLDLGPPREFASTDYMGHIYGAIFSALCGSWHLVNRILQSDLPHLQSWLALIVLCISTLPWRRRDRPASVGIKNSKQVLGDPTLWSEGEPFDEWTCHRYIDEHTDQWIFCISLNIIYIYITCIDWNLGVQQVECISADSAMCLDLPASSISVFWNLGDFGCLALLLQRNNKHFHSSWLFKSHPTEILAAQQTQSRYTTVVLKIGFR